MLHFQVVVFITELGVQFVDSIVIIKVSTDDYLFLEVVVAMIAFYR
jgi:hypothetical protein